ATADALGAAAAAEVVTKVIEAARRGESWAALAVLKRVWPARAGRPTPVALPSVRTAADVPAAIDAVLAAVGRGELSTSEGADLAGLIEAARRGIETTTLAAEVADLRRQVEEIRK
ncbi:MAG: hypothetical protein HQL40_20995, partial [Alphaproteobacteria bacterium]|nr:hypothetical protein [Alphaproteobacteria bacterium]